MPGPDISFWQDRYLTRQTPWDDGADDPEVLAWLRDGTLSANDAPVRAIIERTCLCALHPDHWVRHAQQLHAWLRPGGKLFAQFEQVPRAEAASAWVAGPTYHCDINAMRARFPSDRWAWPMPPYPGGEAGHLTVVLRA